MNSLAPIALVLATVNGPHTKQLSAHELAQCVWDPAAANDVPGHMFAFLGDVDPELQYAFAEHFGIPHVKLIEAAKAFANHSGGSFPLAA